MRTKRSEKHKEGNQFVMLVNALSDMSDHYSLEQRELIRQAIFDSADRFKVKLVSWVILPRSFRVILKTKLVFENGTLSQKNPMVLFAKSFQQIVSAIKIEGLTQNWIGRYNSTDIAKSHLLAAMVSNDTAPVWTEIAPSPDDYFFSSYYHAKFCGDRNAQDWIQKITNSKQSWPDADKAYRKAMDTIISSL